jgi:hypothetical protein
MPDLPSVTKKILPLAVEIEVMRRGGSKDEQKPHKLFMLCAVLDLFDEGVIAGNRIYFDEKLIRNFEKYFRIYAKDEDWCQPGPPFFHLRSSTFWKHKIKPGRESLYSKLTSSGGGVKRIKDNIEYAYLDENSFALFSEAQYRNELRNIILGLLTATNMDRIPTLFHESFSLSRTSLLQILKAVKSAPTDVIFKSKQKREVFFDEQTKLGSNYIKAMPAYCKGTGLLDFKYNLTSFGKIALINDPLLEQPGTQWLMHYHLSAPHGPGPAFWNEIISKMFYAGNIFSSDDLVEQIGNFIWQTESRILAKRGVQSTATIFTGTYTKPEGLAKLHLLEGTDSGRYRVCEPAFAPVWAIGCALLDFWEAQYPRRLGVGLDTLQESGFLKLFLLGKSEFNDVLKTLQEAGYIDVHRSAPPFQVVLLRQDQEGLLQKLYGQD